MEDIQIYYSAPQNVINSITKQGFEIDPIVRSGDKDTKQLQDIINSTKKFCREQKSITIIHLKNSITSNITLYANLDNEVVGILTFMNNVDRYGNKFINFDGICSPENYSGKGIGEKLIDTLIRIGKLNDIKYINLECKGELMKYYKKFGFVVTSERKKYDSDEDSDEDSDDESETSYYMRLDLSMIAGRNKRRRLNKSKRNSRIKKRNRRTRRKLRK
jgi:ribosomal protein S18 acetylase RimI-like enzyme